MDSKYNLMGGKIFPKFPMNKSTTVVNFNNSPKKPRLDQGPSKITQLGPGTLLQQRKSLPVYGVRNRHVKFVAFIVVYGLAEVS
jgi:hypothetical protein